MGPVRHGNATTKTLLWIVLNRSHIVRRSDGFSPGRFLPIYSNLGDPF